METFVYNIGQVLGITLFHSVWQGLLIYGLVRILLIAFPAADAVKKYYTLYAALMAMAIWFGYTFFMEAKVYNWPTPVAQHFALVKDIPFENTTITQSMSIERPFYYSYKTLVKAYLPYISALYLISVLINLVRMGMGWQNIRNIKKQAVAADAWQPFTDKQAESGGILKRVQICYSTLVDVPCALGYLKPIILLPFSISTQLSAEEIEVIILHELAHIKNNDYILNLIQQSITLLLFLNPFAQLINRMIDVERENRCDDIVVQIGNPLTYAGALVKLEKNRQQCFQLAMAVTGKKYHLFARVKRIMSDDKPAVNIKHLVFGLLIFISALGSIAWLNPEIKDGKLTSKNGEAAVKQLARIVKAVIAPDAPDQTKPAPVVAEMHVNSVTDSTAEVPVNVTVVDSIALRRVKTDALNDEYEKVSRDWREGIEKLKEIPEGKEAELAQKMYDSVRKIKVRALFTPELEQESRDINIARSKFNRRPDVIQKNTEQRQYYIRISAAIKNHPEMMAFEQEYTRLDDSVRKAIMQANNLTESQLQKNAEWIKWKALAESKKLTLNRKLSYVPEIRALQDSVESIANWITSDPEYQTISKTKLSQAYRDALNPPGLEKYEAELNKAKEKLKNTALFIKVQQDQERFLEIQRQLRAIAKNNK